MILVLWNALFLKYLFNERGIAYICIQVGLLKYKWKCISCITDIGAYRNKTTVAPPSQYRQHFNQTR